MDRQIKVLSGDTNYVSVLTKEKKSLRLRNMYLESLYFTEEQGLNLG